MTTASGSPTEAAPVLPDLDLRSCQHGEGEGTDDAAADRSLAIFRAVDECCHAGDFARVDDLLLAVDVAATCPMHLISWLTATRTAHVQGKLTGYGGYYRRVLASLALRFPGRQFLGRRPELAPLDNAPGG